MPPRPTRPSTAPPGQGLILAPSFPAYPPESSQPTPVAVDGVLLQIRRHAAQLNEMMDHAAMTVHEVEEFLNEKCSLGIHTIVQIERDGQSGIAGTYLEYKRVGARFRVAIVKTNEEGDDVEVKAWSDSTREAKIESFKKLPDLLLEISKKTASLVQVTETSIRQVQASLTALSGG